MSPADLIRFARPRTWICSCSRFVCTLVCVRLCNVVWLATRRLIVGCWMTLASHESSNRNQTHCYVVFDLCFQAASCRVGFLCGFLFCCECSCIIIYLACVCAFVSPCVFTRVYLCFCVCTCVHLYECESMSAYVCLCVCARACVCMCCGSYPPKVMGAFPSNPPSLSPPRGSCGQSSAKIFVFAYARRWVLKHSGHKIKCLDATAFVLLTCYYKVNIIP